MATNANLMVFPEVEAPAKWAAVEKPTYTKAFPTLDGNDRFWSSLSGTGTSENLLKIYTGQNGYTASTVGDVTWSTGATAVTSSSLGRTISIGDKIESWMTDSTGSISLITGDSVRIDGSQVIITNGSHYNYIYGPSPVQQAYLRQQQLRQAIRSNLLIRVRGGNRSALANGVPPQELKARNTLRDMLSEAEYRRYLTNSFIMVRGASNRWYQIFNDRSRIVQVYEKNVKVGTLCIHTLRECPPSDHVINMKVLIELDEAGFLKLGNYRDFTKDAAFSFGVTADGARREGEALAKFAQRLRVELPSFTIREGISLAC